MKKEKNKYARKNIISLKLMKEKKTWLKLPSVYF